VKNTNGVDTFVTKTVVKVFIYQGLLALRKSVTTTGC